MKFFDNLFQDENWDTGTILLSRPEDFRVDNVRFQFNFLKCTAQSICTNNHNNYF